MKKDKIVLGTCSESTFVNVSDQSGFSLLGALIAMVIFMVGILAVFSMQTKTVQSASRSTQLTQSSAWAQDTIETLITNIYDDPAFEPPYSAGEQIDPLEPVTYDDNSLPGGFIHQRQEGPYTIKWVVFTSFYNGAKINDFVTISGDEMFENVDKTQILQDIPDNAKLVTVYVSHPSEKYSQYAFVKSNI